MNNIGFVKNIETIKSRTFLTIVLNYEELEKAHLKIGEFLKITTGSTINKLKIVYLGQIVDVSYRPVTYDDYGPTLALAKLNGEGLDKTTVKNINFMHYKIVILGEIEIKDNTMKLYPSTRTVPSLVDVTVSEFEPEELKSVINISIESNNLKEQKAFEFEIGCLQYGSNPNNAPEFKGGKIGKKINIGNFIRKRTANFGKTGFGKSNENKAIITLLAKDFPDLSMLIFDVDGEYAFADEKTTSKGLYDTFSDIGLSDKIVVYSNREDIKDYASVRPFKVDFYKFPELAAEFLYQKRKSQNREANYIEDLYNNIDETVRIGNKKTYLCAAMRKANLAASEHFEVHYSNRPYNLEHEYSEYFNENSESESDCLFKILDGHSNGDKNIGKTKLIYEHYNIFSFLKDFHSCDTQENIFNSILQDITKHKKIVILDLKSIDSDFAPMLMDRIANTIFEKSQELFDRHNDFNTIFLVEEAHFLLSDPGKIWYRIAREGRKFGIGLIYSTQSPNSIPNEILSLTENFFVKHLSSSEDTKALEKAKASFAAPISEFILNEPVIGLSYIYMEPYQPFVVPVKIKLLDEILKEIKG